MVAGTLLAAGCADSPRAAEQGDPSLVESVRPVSTPGSDIGEGRVDPISGGAYTSDSTNAAAELVEGRTGQRAVVIGRSGDSNRSAGSWSSGSDPGAEPATLDGEPAATRGATVLVADPPAPPPVPPPSPLAPTQTPAEPSPPLQELPTGASVITTPSVPPPVTSAPAPTANPTPPAATTIAPPPPPPPTAQLVFGPCQTLDPSPANGWRASLGLSALAQSSSLVSGSCAWSLEMARQHSLSHGASNEVVHYATGSGQAFSGWRDSAAHYQLLTSSDPRVTQIGCGQVRADYPDGSTRHWSTCRMNY